MNANAFKAADIESLWDYGKPAETETKFREMLKEKALVMDPDYKQQLKTQLARALGLQKKFDEAHKVLDEVRDGLTKDVTVFETRYLLERGRVFNSSGKKEEALSFFNNAFKLASDRKQDFFAVDAAHMLGIAESTSEKQMEWNLKAVAIAEKSKDAKARVWLGSLYNNIGWTHHDSKKYREALTAFEKALNYREEQGKPENIHIAKWSVARALRSLGKFEEALKIQTALLKDNKEDGYVYEELGELYLALGKKKESEENFKKSRELLKK